MPRMITSDDESDSDMSRSPSAKAAPVKKSVRKDENGNEDASSADNNAPGEKKEEGDDEEEEEEEFVVESILDHQWDEEQKAWVFQTKWLGWDQPEDMTWEPKENLEGARETLEEYFEAQFGSRATPPPPTSSKAQPKKRGRKSTTGAATTADSNGGASSSKKQRTGGRGRPSASGITVTYDSEDWGLGGNEGSKWMPPPVKKDAWEEKIETVETIEPDESGEKWAYLRWVERDNNGRHRKTKERLQQVYLAAPQIMLQFYERHLVFGKPEK